jgi:hypothetical protein
VLGRLRLAGAVAGVGLAAFGASHAAGEATAPAARAATALAARAATAPAAGAATVGRAAHVVSVKDEGHLHAVRESGSNLTEEGPVSGSIPGTVRVDFNIGPTVYASFTIYPHGGGTISGHGHGNLHSTGLYATFGGSLTVTHGTGRYAHAHGSGGLYGAINRKTYALTVQAVGKLYY